MIRKLDIPQPLPTPRLFDLLQRLRSGLNPALLPRPFRLPQNAIERNHTILHQATKPDLVALQAPESLSSDVFDGALHPWVLQHEADLVWDVVESARHGLYRDLQAVWQGLQAFRKLGFFTRRQTLFAINVNVIVLVIDGGCGGGGGGGGGRRRCGIHRAGAACVRSREHVPRNGACCYCLLARG